MPNPGEPPARGGGKGCRSPFLILLFTPASEIQTIKREVFSLGGQERLGEVRPKYVRRDNGALLKAVQVPERIAAGWSAWRLLLPVLPREHRAMGPALVQAVLAVHLAADPEEREGD